MSHRNQTHVPEHRTARRNATVPPASRPNHYGAETRKRASVASSASGGRQSADSNEDFFSKASTQRRLSGLPRLANTASGARLDEIASSRPTPVFANSALLKASRPEQSHTTEPDSDIFLFYPVEDTSSQNMTSTEQSLARRRAGSNFQTSLDSDAHMMFGQSLPRKHKPPRPVAVAPPRHTEKSAEELPPRLIPELQALAAATAAIATANSASGPPASTGSISSPSTLFTESPGVWSSRNTTPMSMSSYSPAAVPPLKGTSTGKRANTVPIPSVPKTKLPRLPALPEALHSSSSSMIGKEVSPLETRSGSKKKKTPLNSPAPTPPPRTSSVNRKASRSGSNIPSTRTEMAQPREAPELENSPLTKRASKQIERVGESLEEPLLFARRDDTDHRTPVRPSRSGVWSLDPRRPLAVESSLPSSRRDKSRSKKDATADKSMETTSGLRKPIRGGENIKDGGTRGADNDLSHRARGNRPEAPLAIAPSKIVPKVLPSPSSNLIPGPEAASNTRLGKFSRFAIFSRRSKPAEVKESPRKLQRKGPVAGTGHEGYGKFSRRGRKTSSEGDQSESGSDRSESSLERIQIRLRTRKHSTSSRRDRSSQSDLDEFAAKRLQPVVMVGGSAKANDPGEFSRNRLENETLGASSGQVIIPWVRDESMDRSRSILGTGSEMNSSMGSISGLDQEVSGPYVNRYLTAVPMDDSPDRRTAYPSSANTSQSSIAATMTTSAGVDPSMYRVDAKLLKSQEKKGKKSKWNFFSRSTQPPRPSKQVVAAPAMAPQMPVRISAGPIARSVPYYAVMDSESENNTTDTLGQVLSEAVESPPPVPRNLPASKSTDVHHNRGHSVLLPSLPLFEAGGADHTRRPSSPRVPFQWKEDYDEPPPETPKEPPPRPRRLAAVGRIPRVVSRKGRQSPSAQTTTASTTGAYLVSAPHSVQPTTADGNPKPVLGVRTDLMPNRRLNFLETGRQVNESPAVFHHDRTADEPARKEFLRFPSKNSSYASASSTSTGLFNLTAPTHALPTPPYPPALRHTTGEDEVWNEYDDFIDHVMSPVGFRSVQPPPKTEAPSVKSSRRPQPGRQPRQPALAKQATLPEAQSSLHVSPPPVLFPPPMLLSESSSSGEIRLRRSRIVSALHSSLDPSSPFSIGDFLSQYGDWNRNSTKLSERLSTSTAHRSGYLSPASAAPSEEIVVHAEHSQQHNAILLDVVGRSKDPAAQSELHFSSLMISRWLSFGRVLFSPAHDEIHNIAERRVLVLDGLGSVDWSVYCAVIYQDQKAYVHDLKEKDAGQSPIDPAHTPPNYRRAEISSLADRFPFPPSFFSAIVLRFPPLMSDQTLSNIISECKRVLSPGGYLELMLLDLDIVNMGKQTGQVLRDLKIRITTSDRTISLKPLSDNLQSHLGQHGFLNLSRCVVGVPVAGRVSGSLDSSSSSRSSRGSYVQHSRLSADAPKTIGNGGRRHSHNRHGHNFSLNDLVSDHSENADEKIGKMVSRTARSWWQHCFEAAVIPDGNLSRSIFADKGIIRECKMRGSNFKLLIAYTQKPPVLEMKRRTMSEPHVTTLATAGTGRPKRTAS